MHVIFYILPATEKKLLVLHFNANKQVTKVKSVTFLAHSEQDWMKTAEHHIRLLKPQGQNYLLSLHIGWSGASYAEGNTRGSTEHPLSIWRIQPALIMAVVQKYPGHFTVRNLSNKQKNN